MMKLKDDSINARGIGNELLLALMIADTVYMAMGTEMVITSIYDGYHSLKSLHYTGNAVDVSVANLPLDKVEPDVVVKAIKDRLNIDYDVVYEEKNAPHIHIEYQPRRRPARH